MTYDLYDVILDLAEAGFSIQFSPKFTAEDEIRPRFITIRIQNDIVASGGTLKTLTIKEGEEDELIKQIIEFTKYAVRKMALMEDKDEPSATQGSGPAE